MAGIKRIGVIEMKKGYRKTGVSVLFIFSLLVSLTGNAGMVAQAKAETSVPTVTVKIGTKKVNKKTYTMKQGSSKKVRLAVTPKNTKVKAKYSSSKTDVVSVSKTGVLKAKKAGTAKITVKVSGKIQKKLWFKVKVVNQKNTDKTTEIPVTLTVGGKTFYAKFYDNQTTRALVKKMPMTLPMKELNGNEKYYYFSESFPTDAQKVSQIHAGDLKLYGSSCLVLFYESFSTSYSYTDLGYVENPEGLAEALGTGNVSVEIAGVDK
ncbi:MAG: cyclophilin-like fold protein [Clostridium sp.]|nr:cyclophilin-like fold protein [Clostridium sp.]